MDHFHASEHKLADGTRDGHAFILGTEGNTNRAVLPGATLGVDLLGDNVLGNFIDLFLNPIKDIQELFVEPINDFKEELTNESDIALWVETRESALEEAKK